MKWLQAIGLSGVQVGRDEWLRIGVLLLTCVVLGLLVVDYGASATHLELAEGDVAPRTIKAPRSFPYVDAAERARLQEEARQAVLPVYAYRSDLLREQHEAVGTAFDDASRDLTSALGDAEPSEPDAMPTVADLSEEQRAQLRKLFLDRLGVNLLEADIDVLMHAGFPSEARALTQTLLREAMDRPVIADRADLPADRSAMHVLSITDDGSESYELRDYEAIAVPDEVRRDIDMRRTLHKNDAPWVDVSAHIARAMVRPNFRANPKETELRREQAADAVPPVEVWIKRGTVLFRDGEALTSSQIDRYRALQATSNRGLWLEVVSIIFFVGLLTFVLVHFGSSHLRPFSLRLRDLAAVGALLALMAILARLVWALSAVAAELIGYGCEPDSVWFIVPVAGAAMLVRLLVGVNWALITSIVASAVCGLIFGLDALVVLYLLGSGVVAAGAVQATRERMSVMRAGVYAGTVNAALALLIHFLGYYMGAGEVAEAFSARPLWSMSFAFLGGLVSAFLVLGLMPLFEAVGFVTDYRLMELANLNHPLMRKLMLRAPGSYHHSVVVGSLAEAACEAIGANALQARVSAYFHDIGKAVKPHYFVENQGSGGSRHKGLDPYTSAAIIISHVTNEYVALHATAAQQTSELIQTSCGRNERIAELLEAEPPADLEQCIAYLGDRDVMMQITVQQMAFRASTGELLVHVP